MRKDGNNSQDMKRANWALLLESLATGRANTRIELARLTGLSKMSVTNIVDRFIEAKLFRAGGEQETGNVGRKPQTLLPNPAGPLVLGIYLARDGLHGVLCDLSLKKTAQRYRPLADETRETLTGKLTGLCKELLALATRPVWGLGVATIGPVDIQNGVLLNPREFYDINAYPLRDILAECTGFSAVVENDMNAAALAELYYGAGRSYEMFLYIGLTAGVGSGIIYNRELYQQGYGLAGELGHTGVDPNGLLCPCGRRGCLERYVSIPALSAALERATGVHATFAGYCETDSPQVQSVLDEAVDTMCYAVLNQVNMLNPQAVIIGHEGAHLPGRSVARFGDALNAGKLWGGHSRVVVEKARFGDQAPVYGAATAVLAQWFSGNLPKTLELALHQDKKEP